MAMATHLSAPLSSKSLLKLHRSTLKYEISHVSDRRIGRNIPSTHLSFRVDNVTSSIKRRRFPILFAQPSEGEIVKDKSEEIDTSGNQGPPILTILAGFLVLLLVFWVLGSIVTWLVSLIMTVSPSK